MDNEKFQELVLKHLEDNAKRLEGISEKLVEHDRRFDGYDKRFDNLETLGKQHHDELEKVASQVEKLIQNEDEITDFLLKRRRRI